MDGLTNFRGVIKTPHDAKFMYNGKAGDYFFFYRKLRCNFGARRALPVYDVLVYVPELDCWSWKWTFDPYESWR